MTQNVMKQTDVPGVDQSPSGPVSDAFDVQQTLLHSRHVRVVFDVGGHRGSTVAKYRRRFPEALIYGFEPYPESFAALVERFCGDSQVRPVEQAVADTVGRREFFVNGFSPTNSLFPRPQTARRYYPRDADTRSTIEVPVTTVDTFCRVEGIAAIDVLKMDIQGGELLALKGAAGLLRDRAISLIYTEVLFVPHYEDGARFHELCGYLATYGYSLYDVFSPVHADNGQLRYADALFVSEELRHDVIDQYPEER